MNYYFTLLYFTFDLIYSLFNIRSEVEWSRILPSRCYTFFYT